MLNEDSNYLRPMRDQYEHYPYPMRDPGLEAQRLILTETDYLGKVSHYCYNGRLDLRNGFRVLVAGGGTGDAAIFLAEQLRGHDAEVAYLDMSLASTQIAKDRAERRGLDNITWVHGSIHDVQKLGLGVFDYINCCGVLMVLEDPVAGLRALKSCLKENAAIGIMVYAKYGRTGVYHMQELMQLINAGEADHARRIKNAKNVFSSLPATHCLKKGPVPLSEEHAAELDDSDWFDLFLIAQDRAYTVTELYEWLSECNLKLINFAAQRTFYDPETHLTDQHLLKVISKFPVAVQQAIAENLVSTISRHRFYTGVSGATMASFDDKDNVPYFCDMVSLPVEATTELKSLVSGQSVGASLKLYFRNENLNIDLPIQKLTGLIIKYVDGARTISEIIKSVRNDPEIKSQKVSTTQVTQQFRQLYDFLSVHNLMLLRHKDTAGFKTYQDLQL